MAIFALSPAPLRGAARVGSASIAAMTAPYSRCARAELTLRVEYLEPRQFRVSVAIDVQATV